MESVDFDLFPDLLDNNYVNFTEDVTFGIVETSETETKEEASDLSSNSSADMTDDYGSTNMDDLENQVQASSSSNSNDNKITVVSKTSDPKVLTVKVCNAKDLQKIIQFPQNTYATRGSDKKNNINNAISKNAMAARENRLKKKKYIEDLENSVTKLQKDNKQLKIKASENDIVIANLKKENAYLSNVLANASELSALLKNIGKTEGIKFSPLNGKRKGSEDFMNVSKKLCVESETQSKESVGVCLHVSNKKVSLEFCPSCNENANEN